MLHTYIHTDVVYLATASEHGCSYTKSPTYSHTPYYSGETWVGVPLPRLNVAIRFVKIKLECMIIIRYMDEVHL